jgi:integrase
MSLKKNPFLRLSCVNRKEKMAGYRKREGKWEVRIRRLNQKGISKTFVSKEDAQKWAREYEAKIEKGLFEDLSHANSISLKELLQQYCNEVSSTKRGFAEEKYKINKLCKDPIAGLKLAKITPLKIRKFQDSWGLSHNPSTINKYITLISVAIKYARQMLGIYLPNNPCDFVQRLKEPEFEGQIIERHEEELLLSQAEHSKANWLKLSIMLGIDCGLRRGEILGARRENLDFVAATLKLNETKNGYRRVVGLSPRVIEEIKKLPINIDGRIINCPSADNFYHFYNQLQKWTGIKKSFHCTRHTFATRCVEKGWTIQEISAQGGWRDLRVLKRYTHLSANHLAKKLGS